MGAYIRLLPGESVRVGKLTLPGVVTSIQVQGDLQLDEQDLENTNLKTLAVLGYTTQRVRVGLVLTAETQAELDRQVRQIQQVFQVDRVKASGAKLVPVRIVSPHLDARRVKVVVFDGFISEETAELEVTCTLTFHEFESDVARIQERIEQGEKRRAEEAERKKDGTGKDGKGKGGKGGTGKDGQGTQGGKGVASGSGPNGTPAPPGGGKGTAGGTNGGGGPPPILSGFEAGSGAARALLGR